MHAAQLLLDGAGCAPEHLHDHIIRGDGIQHLQMVSGVTWPAPVASAMDDEQGDSWPSHAGRCTHRGHVNSCAEFSRAEEVGTEDVTNLNHRVLVLEIVIRLQIMHFDEV